MTDKMGGILVKLVAIMLFYILVCVIVIHVIH